MTDINPVTQVEDRDDIDRIPATVSGTEAADKTSTEPAVKHGDNIQESSSVNINTSELPPHIVLEMPALSPTMVRTALAVMLYHFTIHLYHIQCEESSLI